MEKKLSNLQKYIVISAKHKSIEEFYFSDIDINNDSGDEVMYSVLIPEMVSILMKFKLHEYIINVLLNTNSDEVLFYKFESKIKKIYVNPIKLEIQLEINNEIHSVRKVEYDGFVHRYLIDKDTKNLSRKYNKEDAAYNRSQFEEIIFEHLNRNQNEEF